MEPVLYESHMHTPLCRHAVGEPEEYAARAEQRGLKGIIVTCHNPTPFRWRHCMTLEELPDYIALVERARRAWAGKVDVRMGIECDFMPGMEDWLREHLANLELHHVLGSIHPQVRDYAETYFHGDLMEFQRTYFEHLAVAAETGLFDTLSHPDLVKNFAPNLSSRIAQKLRAVPYDWNVERLMPDIERALDRIAATGVAMELNTSGLYKAVPEMNPGPMILRAMQKRGIPVVIGADAHVPERVADRYEDALDALEAAGYDEVSFFLERRRQTVPIAVARASLRS